MIDFEELDLPRVAGDNDDKWIVLSADDMFLVLSKSAELEYGPEMATKDYHFDTELDAHFAASYYYSKNKMGYPYGDAMLNSAEATPLIFDEDESETMEFV